MLRDKIEKGFIDDIDSVIWKKWNIGFADHIGRVISLNAGQSWNDEFGIDYADLGCGDV